MYQKILGKYRKEIADFPRLRRPRVGAVIKETRVDKGIRQMDFARQVGIHASTLKSIENDHQQATTVENLSKCAKALGMDADEIILLGREKDPANCFVFKRAAPPKIKGIRKRKCFPEEWHESLRLRFKDFDLNPLSAPLVTRKDFFLARMILPPKRSTETLQLPLGSHIAGFVSSGFNIKILLKKKETPLTASQGFAFEGSFPHTIVNGDEDHTAVIYLMATLSGLETARGIDLETPLKDLGRLDISRGIEEIRRRSTARPGRALPLTHLADLTDSLNHEQITKLMRLKKGSAVIYWEKIEDLVGGTGVSMEKFLGWCRASENAAVSISTAVTRPVVDFSPVYGLKIFSAVPAGPSHRFSFGEIKLEGKQAVPRKSWQRKDESMMAFYVEEGEVEVAVGKRRSPLTLSKGESIYFDASLGYSVRNPGEAEAKGFFAAYPAIPF